MSEIIETYQEEQERLASPKLPGLAFATVVSVNEDGLELRFDGEEAAASKRYPCNVGVKFEAGQRALLMKVNGSYVALCPVGLQGGGGGAGTGILTESVEERYGTVNASAFVESYFNAAKTGYTLLGVIGHCVKEVNTPTAIQLSYCYVDGTRIRYGLYNPTNTRYLNIYLNATLMYVKN